MYSTRYDNLDREDIKSFPPGITHINADNSPVLVTVPLSDSNTTPAYYGKSQTTNQNTIASDSHLHRIWVPNNTMQSRAKKNTGFELVVFNEKSERN